MKPEMIEMLKKLAQTECFYDYPLEEQKIHEQSGGDTTSAFGMGELAGQILLAREILKSGVM